MSFAEIMQAIAFWGFIIGIQYYPPSFPQLPTTVSRFIP